MKRSEIKLLIRECLNESLTDQSFDDLRSNISSRTQIGENWNKAVLAIEGMYEEIKNFEGLYRTGISQHGKPANIQEAIKRIEQVAALLQAAKPTVLSMDIIQRKDMMS